MPHEITFDILRGAVSGDAAAFRCRTELQPAGGVGDKVFPPTYEGGKYAVEERRLPGYDEPVTCVLLDSVQSQANRMEEALQQAMDAGRLTIPVVEVDFTGCGLLADVGRVTSLQAPHRLADAILRDSIVPDEKVPFRQSQMGRRIDTVSLTNATPIYEMCPTALLFGMWDSTGAKGGLGAKFQRAIVSEVVGIRAAFGVKTSSRLDPLQIVSNAGTLYQRARQNKGIPWTAEEAQAERERDKRTGEEKPKLLGKSGKPSEANHGNIPPQISAFDKDTGRPKGGGVTIASAERVLTLSLPALRRLRFPLDGAKPDPEVDAAGRVVLAALGLCAAALAAERGFDLRSRCLLWPTEPSVWELLAKPGEAARTFVMEADSTVGLLQEAVERAEKVGLAWHRDPLVLTPSADLVALVRRSQERSAAAAMGEEEADATGAQAGDVAGAQEGDGE